MARTKASVGAKLSSGKNTKARNLSAPPPSTNSGSATKGNGGSAGNPYFPRETPNWQIPITRFFIGGCPEPEADGQTPGSSKANSPLKKKKKVNVITSDTESDNEEHSENQVKVPQEEARTPEEIKAADISLNQSLDTSIMSTTDLPPLSPEENSHKIREYFSIDIDKCDENVLKVKLPTVKNKGKGKGKTNKKTKETNCNSTGDSMEVEEMINSNGKENLVPNNETNKDDTANEKVATATKRGLEEVENSITKKIKVC